MRMGRAPQRLLASSRCRPRRSHSIASTIEKTPEIASIRSSSTTLEPTANIFILTSNTQDFKTIESTRPPFNPSLPVTTTQSPDPTWTYGAGTTKPPPSKTPTKPPNHQPTHLSINPSTTPTIQNYRLLISSIPRPISLISTLSATGTPNLAPFSYFTVVDHNPCILVVGFSARSTRPKDTRQNLIDTGECVINLVSEDMIHAVNATSLDVPHGTSEWSLSGLSPAPSKTVKPPRVAEAIVSIEGVLREMKVLDYAGVHAARNEEAGALAIIEATNFWVREDAFDEGTGEVKLDVHRPLTQLGGISYGRVRETFELPRTRLSEALQDEQTEVVVGRFLEKGARRNSGEEMG